MERGSLDKLKQDSRLASRKGWIEEADREAFVNSLPDVSDKIAAPAEEPPAAEPRAEAPAAAAPPAAAPEPISQPLNPLAPPFEEVSE